MHDIAAVHGERALAEVSAGIERQAEVDGVETDLISSARLPHWAHRQAGVWKIVSLDPIYECDTLQPIIPGAALRLDPAALAGFRTPGRLLASYRGSRGYEIADDDEPEAIDALYADAPAWLRA